MLNVTPGDTFGTRNKPGVFRVVSLDGRGGFTAARANGKTVKVTAGRIAMARRMLAEGPVLFRKVDYTVAVEAGVVYALRDELVVDAESKTYIAKAV